MPALLAVGCGEPDKAPPLLGPLDGSSDAALAAAQAPSLMGAARTRTTRQAPPAPPPKPQPRTEAGRLSVAPGASWDSVCACLREEAAYLRERDGLAATSQLLLELEGVTGRVVIGPRGAEGPPRVGLDLGLEGPFGALAVQAVGLDWATELGCEAPLAWRAAEPSLAVWAQALESLRETGAATSDAVDVRAFAGLPATTVLAFVEAATRASFGPPRILVGGADDADESPPPLRWLPSHQAPSGAWDDVAAVGLCAGRQMGTASMGADRTPVRNAAETALVLLAFLSAGYTPDGDHEFSVPVSRGLASLVGEQGNDGSFPAATGWSRARTQALATLLLLEACTTSSRADLDERARRALLALETAYWSSGDDVVAVAWVARALHAASRLRAQRLARGQPAPFEVDAELVARVLKEGESCRSTGEDLRTTCGLVIRLSLDPTCATFDPALAPCAALRDETLKVVMALRRPETAWDPVHGYFATVVAFEVGGKTWDYLKAELERRVADAQRRDGHYCCFKGSWDPPAQMALPGGRTIATALSALTLEYFYRFDRVFGTR